MDILTLRLKNGKPVGTLCAGVATLKVTQRNWFRVAGGYSVDADVLAQIERAGARLIEFLNVEDGTVDCLSVGTFRDHARRVEFGFGPKLVCPARYYIRPDAAQGELFALPDRQPTPQLWGAA